ncbi:cytochrome c oxidase assembly factor Coa1 family protein [Christiangramia sp. SM2212]|uniref:Cytochrome c oxidase assembly factor Coa1 family protein n=1 Tax=Christiangramia sediminicola TaxID=3073267 RepID=A0ABU1EL07_9FLAO|nr:cytochrome c oxidase assembly factor Coa1 family protein [Christiangramia sp. SM2212]MDR5589070.1 cytochrome c oxidase assembly factor Coa1 family protein [Christiangramia sp. SM2212]
MGRNIKWIMPLLFTVGLITYLVSSSGMGKVSSDLIQAYADEELYENAIEKANDDVQVKEQLGSIEPIGKMTILNGEVKFSEDHKTVTSTIKIKGTKEKGKMDITAHRSGEKWIYDEINIRIVDTLEDTQTIRVITSIK